MKVNKLLALILSLMGTMQCLVHLSNPGSTIPTILYYSIILSTSWLLYNLKPLR